MDETVSSHREQRVGASNPDELGVVVREARVRRGLTQAQVAQSAGVTREWLGRLERGANRAELVKVFHVLGALGLFVHLSEASEVARPYNDDFSRLFDALKESPHA